MSAVPVLKDDWCKNCGICAGFCPAGVFSMDGEKAAVAQPERCVGCGRCVELCPDFAIELMDRED